MERRLLGRNQVCFITNPLCFFFSHKKPIFQYFLLCFQGRVDDNIETIKKRFRTFVDSSLPVIEYYTSKDKVKKVLMNFILPGLLLLHPDDAKYDVILCNRNKDRNKMHVSINI